MISISLGLLGLLVVLAAIAHVQDLKLHGRSPYQPRNDRSDLTQDEKNAIKGEQAEDFVHNYRLKTLPSTFYSSYRSLYIPRHYNPNLLTEIDHVVVSSFRVFVIETKSWSGTIKGRGRDDVWRTELGKDTVHEHRNPMKQNVLHVDSLAKFLDLPKASIQPIVCFEGTDVEFGGPMPESVVRDVDLRAYILGFQDEMLTAEKKFLTNRTLREHVARSDAGRNRLEHLAQIERDQKRAAGANRPSG